MVTPSFKLVGFNNFVRTNPKSDAFAVKRFHHIEFWCGDATNTSRRFSWALGIPIVAKSDLSTGNTAHASYLLRSGDLNLLFTAPYSAATITKNRSLNETLVGSTIPSFSAAAHASFAASHGLAVRAVAIEVLDAGAAFSTAILHGAIPTFPPAALSNDVVLAEVHLYGDVVLRLISYKNNSGNPNFTFLPKFESIEKTLTPNSFPDLDLGIRGLDHAVGNVPELAPVIDYIKKFTGFHEFAEFTGEDIGTAESGLNSVVLANNTENTLFALNEPVYGTKRKSQIQTFLEHNEGAGVHHLALSSEDIFRTLRGMRMRSGIGGFEFMPAPPPTYYRNLKARAGDVLSDDQIKECEELGILVDRDDEGTLLQIFTKHVGDRPTIFIEIIQRLGCVMKDEDEQVYQKSGCGGFGKGNFSELFKSVEDYEKMLEAKQIIQANTA